MLKRFREEDVLGKPLTPEQKQEIQALLAKGDEDIDLSDIPEVDFSKATKVERGRRRSLLRGER